MDRTSVAVIGAGVMGTATARALGDRGIDTVLLEQFRLGHSRGSSHGAVRIFRLSYAEVMYVWMAQRALRLWRDLEEEAEEDLLVTTGGVDAGPTAEDCARALASRGAPHEWLTAAEASARFPLISFEGFERLLFQPEAGVSRADRAVAAQARVASARGVDIREGTEVRAIHDRGSEVVVETSEGDVAAGAVVVTAGGWAGGLLAGLVESRPVRLTCTLQQYAYFGVRSGVTAPLDSMPIFIEWEGPVAARYAVPAGGVATGIKVGDHDVGPEVDPRRGPFSPAAEELRDISAYVSRRFPLLDPEPILSETCLYTLTPDQDFVLDRVGNVVLGAGFSGHGFKFGPLIGEILADLAVGAKPPVPLDRFSLSRPASGS